MQQELDESIERRLEEEQVLRALRDPDCSGLLLRGAGGVGKSTLAGRVLRRLDADGRIVMSVARHTTADQVLAEIGQQLFAKAVEFGLPEDDPNRRLAVEIRRPDVEWPDRFEQLSSRFFRDMPLVFFFDDFDENLVASADGGQGIGSPDLAELLAAWIDSPGKTRLLITSQGPFLLPEGRQRRLAEVELGAMEREAADSLMSRLPSLAKSDEQETSRAFEETGGNPLALTLLDAFRREWRGASADLDADDGSPVERLLGEILERFGRDLGRNSVARRMLIGASVYRVPVDDLALLWQVGSERNEDPDLASRVREFNEKVEAVQQAGKNPTPAELGMTDEEFVDALSDMESWMQPPLSVPEEFHEAKETLSRLGLLVAVVPGTATEGDGAKFWTVQRSVARALAERVSEDELHGAHGAHGRAARSWRFRVQRTTEDEAEALEQLVEARFHLQKAGELDEALGVTERVCDQLEVWGAYRRIDQLCREALGWIPERSQQRVEFLLHLGLARESRGLLDEAYESYEDALEVSEALGDRAAVSGACHQLGRVVQEQGKLQDALDWYEKSLALSQELNLPSGTASTISQLGALETERGSPETGLPLNLQSLAIRLEIESMEAAADLFWLRRQREELGEVRFLDLLRERVGEDGASNVLGLLEQFESSIPAEGRV